MLQVSAWLHVRVWHVANRYTTTRRHVHKEFRTGVVVLKTSDLDNDSGYITISDVPDAPVVSVNGKEGVVILTYTDVGAASAEQGGKADSALQQGADISKLNNDVGYITAGDVPDAPVDSVNGETGTVVLDAAAVGAATTEQGAKADTALQPGADISKLNNDAGFITDAGVTKLVAGSNITLTPTEGTGEVKIDAAGGGGGGAVESVNGQVGKVELTASDVGALPDDTDLNFVPLGSWDLIPALT